MFFATSFVSLLAIASPILVLAAPTLTTNPAKELQERATTCTFTSAASAIASKAACATIILNAIAVPAGVTLDVCVVSSSFMSRETYPYLLISTQ